MIISIALWVLSAAAVVIFVGRAWSLGPLRGKSRNQLVRSGVDAVVLLAGVRALAPPPGGASWLWVVAVAALGLGLAGLILSWRSRNRTRWWPTAVYAMIGGGLLAVLA